MLAHKNVSVCLRTIQECCSIMCRHYWYWPEGVVLSTPPAKLPSGKTRVGRWESIRGDQDAVEKIKFLVPAGIEYGSFNQWRVLK